VKNTENAAPKAPHAQNLGDGGDEEAHRLTTILEMKDEADEETVTLGHWSDSRKALDKA
jgi:hypothetical protein